MVDSKAVAVVTEGLEVLHAEQRIFGGVVYFWAWIVASACPEPYRSTCVIYCKRTSMRIEGSIVIFSLSQMPAEDKGAAKRDVSGTAKWGSAGGVMPVAHNPCSRILLLCPCSLITQLMLWPADCYHSHQYLKRPLHILKDNLSLLGPYSTTQY